MPQPLTLKPGKKIRLADFDSKNDEGLEKETAVAETVEHVAALGDLAYRLYAENQRALLLVLQGMDTSGKDGTIRHVLQGANPLSCQVVSFKTPTGLELAHDFLWRVHAQTPRRGNIGIFNRSHYEDVLIARVHKLVKKKVWRERYGHINAFEKNLVDAGTTIVKVFLHISRDEQRERLQARLRDPNKIWKLTHADIEERGFWDDYRAAYEDALTKCNTDHARWHIVPADCKWYRNLLVSRILHQTLADMDPKFPPPEPGLEKTILE